MNKLLEDIIEDVVGEDLIAKDDIIELSKEECMFKKIARVDAITYSKDKVALILKPLNTEDKTVGVLSYIIDTDYTEDISVIYNSVDETTLLLKLRDKLHEESGYYFLKRNGVYPKSENFDFDDLNE